MGRSRWKLRPFFFFGFGPILAAYILGRINTSLLGNTYLSYLLAGHCICIVLSDRNGMDERQEMENSHSQESMMTKIASKSTFAMP
ncbi:hypothetical protein B0F90DRAFT_1673513 [Multifurca ochricompacta]|uniref:Uncharacterized protein n=1 Tax=Multifurca ochricompacta TaxID=376703 RepID=A0AAD4MBP3_9AGAM|nr:hypothetical protein B0F90DRAFT_1673513 [Multifurca ochricompacta]